MKFLAIILCFCLFACEGDNGEPVNYGPAIPQSQVDDALNAPLASVDPLKIQVGQFTDVLQSEILEGEAYETTGEVGTTVVARVDTDTQATFTVLQNSVNYATNKTVSVELTRVAQKNSAAPAPSPTPSPSPTPAPVSLMELGPRVTRYFHKRSPTQVFTQIFKLDDASPTPAPAVQTTYHNLVVSSAVVAPPAAVVAQPNCGGIPNCKITLQKVSFDMLVWNDPSNPDKVHRDFAISGDVPFFANVMSDCDSLLVPVGTVKSLVTLCSDVTNFRFTTP